MLFIFLGLGYIIKTRPKTIVICPLLIFILFTYTGTFGRTFKNSNMRNLKAESCVAIDNYIIEQIVSADKANKKEVDVHIPKFNTSDNWPIATYSKGFADALYDNGIIKNRIKVKYIIDEDVNKMLIKQNDYFTNKKYIKNKKSYFLFTKQLDKYNILTV